jgi:hypothetical protein
MMKYIASMLQYYYDIIISMCGVNGTYRLISYMTDIKVNSITVPNTDKFTSSLLNAKSCSSFSCVRLCADTLHYLCRRSYKTYITKLD